MPGILGYHTEVIYNQIPAGNPAPHPAIRHPDSLIDLVSFANQSIRKNNVSSFPDRKLALSFAGLYGIAGFVGIIWSDALLEAFQLDMNQWMFYQTCRNWSFALCTTILVYLLIRMAQGRYFRFMEETQRLQRIQKVQSNVNQTIIRVHDEQRLFDSACQIAVADGGFALTWIGRYHADRGVVTIIAKAASTSPAHPEVDQVPMAQSASQFAETLRLGRSHLWPDILQAECNAEEKRQALQRGYRSVLFLGIRPFDQLEAIMAIFAAEPNIFEGREIGMLEELASDLGFALAYAEQEKQRNKAEQALRESEANANRILDTAPQAMLVVDCEGVIVRANVRAELLFGHINGSLIGMAVEELMPERFSTAHGRHRAWFADIGGARGMEAGRLLNCVNREGVEFSAEIGLGSVIIGGAMHVVVSVTDITDRILALQALRESEQALEAHKQQLEELVAERTADLRAAEERLRLLLEFSGNGLFGVDTEGRVTFINQTACEILGHPLERFMGRDIHALVHHSYPDGSPYPEKECPLLTTLEEGRKIRIDNEVYWHADGHAIPVIYTSHPMYREDELVGAVISFVDVTALRRAEAAQRLAMTEVERLARLRSEFLANMSHEIRTPLNAVLGLAQVGERESVGRRAQETFRRILDAGQLLLGIVNDILDFSKIEAGKLEVEQTRFDLGVTIDQAVDLVAARACAKKLDFQVEEAADLPAICYGDPLRLSQVLVNLLTNAVKFTEHGGIAMRVSRQNERLLFRVEDTGIGMTEIQMLRLFAPFEQADGSTTRRFGGTGLGLTISKRLVGIMGGGIRVESQPGQGSMFEVWVPLMEPSAPLTANLNGDLHLVGLAERDIDHVKSYLVGRGVEIRQLSATETFSVPSAHVVMACTEVENPPVLEAALAEPKSFSIVCGPGVCCTSSLPCKAKLPRGEHVNILEWPFRPRHLIAPPERERKSEYKVAHGSRLRGISILVVEDNEINRLVLQEMLSGEEVRLICTENGREALERLREEGPENFELVLTDVQMPEMDGYETTLRIREIAPDLPVLGLTAHAMPEERQRCLAAGMVERLVKPIEIDELVYAIRRYARTPVRRTEASETLAPAEVPPTRQECLPETNLFSHNSREEVIDWKALESRFKGKQAFVDRLAESMLTSHANTPLRLRELARNECWEELAFVAHALKGTSSNLGADTVHESAMQTENAAREKLPDAACVVERLALALEELLGAIEARLGQRGNR